MKSVPTPEQVMAAAKVTERVIEQPAPSPIIPFPDWSPIEIFNQARDFISRHCVFTKPCHADVLALWAMHTHVIECFDFTPYIWLHSPEKKCGKTRVSEAVAPLCRNPKNTSNLTEAVLFRFVDKDKPTLLIDEADGMFGSRKAAEHNESLRSLINAGFQRGDKALRLERVGGDNFQAREFDTFCPKMLAGIGRLPETIVDRSIPIPVHRKFTTDICSKLRARDTEPAKPIHTAIVKWASNPELLLRLKEARPDMPPGLDDRREDIWEPLLAIADELGGELPELARRAAQELSPTEDEQGFGAAILAQVRQVVGERDRVMSKDLIDGLWEADALPAKLLEGEEPNYKRIGHWLSKLFKSYGGPAAQLLRVSDKPAKGYEGAELRKIFDRYCQ